MAQPLNRTNRTKTTYSITPCDKTTQTRGPRTILLLGKVTFSLVCLWMSHRIGPSVAYSQTARRALASAAATTCNWDKANVAAEVEALTKHGALWNGSESLQKARKKLKPRHTSLFDSSTLFDEFSTVICQSGSMPRKEVFETWGAALYIHARFGSVRRICDTAAGHGLLAWALLVLDDADKTKNENEERPLTALCVDRRMPQSAEAIQSAMERRWPHLAERFDFVEGSLEQLQPHPTCLLASVHACGGLSDLLVASAAKTGAPIALVPCCHSRKKLVNTSEYAREAYDSIMNSEKVPDLAERLDEARELALNNAGFDVTSVFLPKIFTAKNRLIMASPPNDGPRALPSSQRFSKPLIPGKMPPLETAKTQFLGKFSIPCEDTDKSRADIKTLAGRATANLRKNALHRKNHTNSPEHDISMWLPPSDMQSTVSEKALSKLASSFDPTVECFAVQLGDAFVHSSGRRAKTYRVRYQYIDNDSDAILSNEDAKKIHRELYKVISSTFPGAECR